MTNYQQLAIDAARVAFPIAVHYENPEPIVLHANEFEDVRAAVTVALIAKYYGLTNVPHRQVDLAATHSIHGTQVNAPAGGLPVDDGTTIITAVVTISSDLPIDPPNVISLINEVGRQVDALAKEADIYLSETIFIIAQHDPHAADAAHGS